ncbi:acetylcholinesterase-like isoform X2 [Ptychodera flava]
MSTTTISLWLAMLAITISAQSDYSYVVPTLYGKVLGTRRRALDMYTEEYMGIPYATPPVGDLRYKPSTPIEPWDGVYNASRYGRGCRLLSDEVFGDFIGTAMWNPNVHLSEDCLFMNVWTPHPRPTNAAVLVWIYGGGFYSGVASLEVYHGGTLAATQNVIVVSFNYRVASFGFFYLGHQDAPGNVGLLDQALALQWVQDNIVHFGGDPRRVTIFGESAGAVSVGLHLLSPLSRNFFTRAILQSGSPNTPWATLTTDEAKRRSLELAKLFGCYNDSKAIPMADVAKCMREQNALDILNGEWMDDVHGIYRFPFTPVVDGTFLTETPLSSIERHSFKPAPIMFGTNKDEGAFFLIYYEPAFRLDAESIIDRDIFESTVRMSFPDMNKIGHDAVSFRYIDWWNPEDGAMLRDRVEDFVSDAKIHCPAHEFGYAYASSQEDVYAYFFSQRAFNNPFHEWMGVLHGDEVAFVFGQPLEPRFNFSAEDAEVSRRMMKAWANFAKTGNPNKESLDDITEDTWPKYTAKQQLSFTFNTQALKNNSAVGRGPRLDFCAFWREYVPNLVTATADINEAEREWKEEFHRWSTKYMVDWKAEFSHYVTNKGQDCSSDINDTP